jgi:hypothetical protein
MKETQRRRMTITSSFRAISTDQLASWGYRVVVRGEGGVIPPAPIFFSSRLLEI